MQHTILIVEDSPLQAIMLRRFLVQAGYQVMTAKDGQEGYEMLKKQPKVIELVISDINMPRMNGFELCRAIKNDPELKHCPVILSTALSTPNDLLLGIEVGADNYVPHPWNEKQLLATIDELLKAQPHVPFTADTEVVILKGKEYKINTTRQYILNFLLSTYENIHLQNQQLNDLKDEIQKAYKQLESVQKDQEQILHNIFPEAVTHELMAYGSVTARRYGDATVMFFDFVGFTKSTKDMNPTTLVEVLGYYFENFDGIIEKHHLERIKTMGDGYMCVCGVPSPNPNHAIESANAALEILEFVNKVSENMKEKYNFVVDIRIGIHTGPVVAGVIGTKRPAYDIWGGTVNLASRMESHSQPGKINVSQETYDLIKNHFNITPRGKIAVKNKEGLEMELDMYFVDGKK